MEKPDIERLLKTTEINTAIIELDNYIADYCSYGQELNYLTDQQKTFFFNQELEREVNNGGFHQYFLNSSGAYAHETLASLESIGAELTAGILLMAINCFPEGKVPKDDEQRRKLLTEMSADHLHTLERMDQTFFCYEENLNELNIAYVRKFRDFF